MGSKNYIPQHISPQVLYLEKYLLEKYYDFLNVRVNKGLLVCKGSCKPSEYSELYQYKIKYVVGGIPQVYVIKPTIKYNDDIHMYKDGSLCLYYPGDLNWTTTLHLFDTIIPWTHEWFLFYELYQITGSWQHPFVAHTKI